MIFAGNSSSFHPFAFILVVAAAGVGAPAYAIDPGVATGSLRVDGRMIALTESYAHRHDNEEGVLEGPELRILLASQKVAQTLLAGVRTTRLDELARRGDIEGVLLRIDLRNPQAGGHGALLAAGASRGKSFTTYPFAGGEEGLRKLRIANNRVTGDVRYESSGTAPAFQYAVTFSAPLFREERVSSRLSGAKALASAPLRAYAAYRKALDADDLDAVRRLATPEKLREIDALIAQAGGRAALKMLRETAVAPGVKDNPRVFVRGGHLALLVFRGAEGGPNMQSFIQVSGTWLVD